MTEQKPCRKVPHDNPRGGYMHGEDEDGPYDVDGVLYCGRCHSWFENCEHIKAQPSPTPPKPDPAEAPKAEENCYHCEACALTCSPSQMVCCNCKRVLAGRVFKPAPKMEQREERCDGPLGCMRTVPDGHLDGCLFKPASTLAPEDDPNETCHANTQAGSPPPLKTLAPAEAPKACPRCGVPFSRRGIYHSEGGCYETGIRKSTPAPASATPAATDEDIALCSRAPLTFFELKLIARIEQEKAANAELRAQVKRCHALLQGFVSCTDPEAEPELCGDASKELGGEFCPGSCTTSCDADRDVDRARIRELEEEIERLRSLLYSSKPWPILKEKL